MAKMWDQLTSEEKIEDLRRDMLRIYGVVNSLAGDVQRTWSLSRETEQKLSEALRAIEKLQSKAG